MNDKYLFFLCNTQQLKIFDITTLDLVREIEADADQIKLDSKDYLFLFNTAFSKLSVYKQVEDFKQLEEFDLAESIYEEMIMACDKTSFVSFYNSKLKKHNLYEYE
jgi:hypothetical protein